MNLTPLVSRLYIKGKGLEVLRLQPNWAQQELISTVENCMWKGRPVRVIILKARQIGISTIAQALCYTFSFVQNGMYSLVVAHDRESAEYLLSMTDLYWNTDPFKSAYTAKYKSRIEKSWAETNSTIRVATAQNAQAGRGRTIHFLHGSEVAFWKHPGETMLALNQAIPNLPTSAIFLESTAHGQGNFFHSEWIKAEAGDSQYIPLFFPWYKHPEYLASYAGMSAELPGRLDSDERALKSMGVSDDRLAWRKWALRELCDNDLNKFHQEFPTTPEEAFVATGTNVFPLPKLRACYEPIQPTIGRIVETPKGFEFQRDPTGPLKLYKRPSRNKEWGQYFIGGDPTRTVKGDPAVAQVINRRNLEQVATFRGHVDPGNFGNELARLGQYFNMAMIAPEITGPGYATVGRLQGLNYPFIWQQSKPEQLPGNVQVGYGFQTTAQSKHLAIGWLIKVVVDEDLTIHDKDTYAEMSKYVNLDNGNYGPADESEGGHDDTVTSLAIGVVCHFMSAPLTPYSGAPSFIQEQPQGEPDWMGWGENAGSF